MKFEFPNLSFIGKFLLVLVALSVVMKILPVPDSVKQYLRI